MVPLGCLGPAPWSGKALSTQRGGPSQGGDKGHGVRWLGQYGAPIAGDGFHQSADSGDDDGQS